MCLFVRKEGRKDGKKERQRKGKNKDRKIDFSSKGLDLPCLKGPYFRFNQTEKKLIDRVSGYQELYPLMVAYGKH